RAAAEPAAHGRPRRARPALTRGEERAHAPEAVGRHEAARHEVPEAFLDLDAEAAGERDQVAIEERAARAETREHVPRAALPGPQGLHLPSGGAEQPGQVVAEREAHGRRARGHRSPAAHLGLAGTIAGRRVRGPETETTPDDLAREAQVVEPLRAIA